MKHTLRAAGSLLSAFLILSVPAPHPEVGDPPVHGQSFVWNQDSLWLALEATYAAARTEDCGPEMATLSAGVSDVRRRAEDLLTGRLNHDDPEFDDIEASFFELAPRVAACPNHTPEFLAAYRSIREATKSQSRHWDLELPAVRQRLYRMLYGGRAAVEEVMLQHPDEWPALTMGTDEPSATPSVEIAGLRVHSGDVLVSRGGYPTSALISRGSDYPGNFSHIALVHVDAETGQASIIESHIEIGVAIATPEQYLADKKLRIMVLRPRADLEALVRDPMLPHRAATRALDRARTERIAYDFAMDYKNPDRLFCSEVASAVYRDEGLDLWMGISTISAEGLRRWLASFGVRHFETQEPSDLEYDPQLAVVAEWRDPETLFQDHIDNAVIDAMLEGAERGDELEYDWYRLAPARLAKAYSWIRNRSGGLGPGPEGMSAGAALRNQWFTERHGSIAARVRDAAHRFREESGYTPPYWQLLELARKELASLD